MKHYIGTKMVAAQPMSRAEYNLYRDWELPANENGADEGYLVEYLDGGQVNDARHKGYISWSPKEVFERAYRPFEHLTFGDALVMLKAGKRVARAGWNGKGMWVVHVGIWNGDFGGDLPQDYYLRDFLAMKSADNGMVPWLASQSDMLAEDWMVV